MRTTSRNAVLAGFAGTTCAAVAVLACSALKVALARGRGLAATVGGFAINPAEVKCIAVANALASRHRVAREPVPRESKENAAVAFALSMVHVTVGGRHRAHRESSFAARDVAERVVAVRADTVAADISNASGPVPVVAESGLAASFEANILSVTRAGRRTVEVRALAARATADLFATAAGAACQ